MTDPTVSDLLCKHGRERPNQRALGTPGKRDSEGRPTWDWLSFSELNALAEEYAKGFVASGLKTGDRALVMVRPGPELYGVLFALLRMGAIPVLLDLGMGVKNLLRCIKQIRPTAFIGLPRAHLLRLIARPYFSSVRLVYTAGTRWFWGGHSLTELRHLGASAATLPERTIRSTDEAAIVFTSGSTGPPKGVSYTQGGFSAQVRNIQSMYALKPTKVIAECFAPFVVFDLAMGNSVVLPDIDFTKLATVQPKHIVDAIELNQASVAFASPIVWIKTVRYCQEHQIKLHSLDTVLAAGAPIPADLHRRFRTLLRPGAQVHTPYGCTEGMPVATIGTDEILDHTWALTTNGAGTCVGRPAPGMTLRIMRLSWEVVTDWSDDLLVPAGELGEITIQGAVVSPEYKDHPTANIEAKITHGAGFIHRMGDLGYFDAQGRLWFCGRKSHALHTQNGVIPAVPIEGIFNEHPKVFRCALVGVGRHGDELPVLWIELEDGAHWDASDEAELLAMSNNTKWSGLVKKVLISTGFPVDPRHNSKIKRELLKQKAEQRLPTGALKHLN